MNNSKSVIGWTSLIGAILAVFVIYITYVQDQVADTATETPTETVSTPTPTEEAVKIEVVDGVPKAVGFTATPTLASTATPVPTFTPTPTDAPTPTPTAMPATPTRKPTERVSKPKATNTLSPTKKPVKTQNIVPYPTGKVGTQYTDDPDGHVWKPYARYTAITAKGTAEYRLREMESTASNGLRIVKDPEGVWRYCIALEPQWAGGQSVDIGRCIDINMTNGAVLHCVLADCKRHEHSLNKEGRYGSKGELIEFIVDVNKLPNLARKMGDVSYVASEFVGGIVSVTVLDMYIKGFGGK